MSGEPDLWRLAAGPGFFPFGFLIFLPLIPAMHRRIHDEVARGELSRVEISTLLNVNRELYVANQGLNSAVADARRAVRYGIIPIEP